MPKQKQKRRDNKTPVRTTWGDLRANSTDAVGDDDPGRAAEQERAAQEQADAADVGTVETAAGVGAGLGIAMDHHVESPGGYVGTGEAPGVKPVEPNLVAWPHLSPAEGVGVPGERGVPYEAAAGATESGAGGVGGRRSNLGGPSFANAEEAGLGGATVIGPGPTANQPETLQGLEDAEMGGAEPADSVTEG